MSEKKPEEKKIKKVKKKKRKAQLFETILSFLTLVVSLRFFNDFEKTSFGTYVFCGILFFLLAGTEIARAINKGTKDKLYFAKLIIASVFYVAGGVILIFVDPGVSGLRAAVTLFFVSLVISRIISLIRRRGPLRIIFFVISILFYLIMITASLIPEKSGIKEAELVTSIIVIPVLIIVLFMLVRIIGISVSGVKYELILKIARTTMAGEILSGLAVLILSFSAVFSSQEPSIDTYFDGLWYSFAIVTTIGFGDVYAETGIGRTLSVILGIYGIIVVALITSIIVNFYNELKNSPPEEKKPEEIEASDEEQELEWYGDYI